MIILPDDSGDKEKKPVSSDQFRSYDIYSGRFEDDEPSPGAKTGSPKVNKQHPEPDMRESGKRSAEPSAQESGKRSAEPEAKEIRKQSIKPDAREKLNKNIVQTRDVAATAQKALTPAQNALTQTQKASSPAIKNTAAIKPAVAPDGASSGREIVTKTQKPATSVSGANSPTRQAQIPGTQPRRPSQKARRTAIDAEYTESGSDIAKRNSAAMIPGGRAPANDFDVADERKTDDTRTTASSKENEDLDTGPEGFKVKFDFEGEYTDMPEERPLRWRRERRTGCVGGILYAAFIICISILLASLAWLAASDVLGFGAVDEEVNMTITADFTIDDIADLLYDAGLIRYKFLFKIYAGYSSAEEKITAGAYVLNKNFDYRALVHGMTTRGGARVETTVQIPEGYTLLQVFALLEEKQVCDADKLWNSAQWYNYKQSFLPRIPRGIKLRLEGYLFPDTYNFYVGSTPEQAISKMLNEFDNKFTEQFTERAEALGYSIHEIITIASMIEREAGTDEERPHIASVIYNRLNSKDFPLLQIDATIYYAIAGTGRPFSTDIDSPYNTYIHEGLPPGPIANPGLASIRAALYPVSSKDYYYALNKSGSHDFFDTYAKQQAFVQSDEYGGR